MDEEGVWAVAVSVWGVIYNRRTMQPLPFDQFSGSYNVLGELGRGASGICYHIVTASDRHHYALKKIPLHLVDPRKLPAELALLSMVKHPNIIQLQQCYLSKDFLYLLFDYTQQRDLQKIIKERERLGDYFEEKVLWGYLKQLLEALAYLQSKAILHRDVKPSNIFVDSDGNLQLGDLGSAKISQRQNYTRVGTPLYLAPEIIKYEAYSEKVDIWSLGVTLFQLAALRPPFQHPNFIKLAQSITYEQPQYPLHFSKRLKTIISEMLHKNPAQRPTAQDLLQNYFITPPQSLPEEEADGEATSIIHSMKVDEEEEVDETAQVQLEEAEWEVQLCGIRESQRMATRLSIHRNSVDEDQSRTPSVKTLGRNSSNRIVPREDEIRENSGCLSRSQLQDGDDTIVLQVNPNDCANFCGYYRESPRPSRIHFAPADQSNALRMGRKSSLFKQPPEPQLQNPSHFKSTHTNKENRNSVRMETVETHRRQESGIAIKQRHGELMSSLRPLRQSRQEQGRAVVHPELIVIDLKPLLLPYQRSSID